jgi:hypothetical protein
MVRTIAACAATAAATLAIIAATGLAASRPFAPACPRPTFGADGNAGPLFCVIDNPFALRYFAKIGRRTFALGPDASPSQVVAAIEGDYRHDGGTNPIMCSVYRLAAWRNQWHFGVSIVPAVAADMHLIPQWCSDPHFAVAD